MRFHLDSSHRNCSASICYALVKGRSVCETAGDTGSLWKIPFAVFSLWKDSRDFISITSVGRTLHSFLLNFKAHMNQNMNKKQWRPTKETKLWFDSQRSQHKQIIYIHTGTIIHLRSTIVRQYYKFLVDSLCKVHLRSPNQEGGVVRRRVLSSEEIMKNYKISQQTWLSYIFMP